MAKAVVIPPAGDVLVVDWPEGDDERLQTMYHHIKGYVELVNLPEAGIHMWADEEGLLKPDPQHNLRASVLAQRPIVGTVVLTPFTEGPRSQGFTEEEAEKIGNLFD
jgi:hypothetical protein